MGAVSRCSLAMFNNDAFGQLDRIVADSRSLFRASDPWSGISAEGCMGRSCKVRLAIDGDPRSCPHVGFNIVSISSCDTNLAFIS